VQVKPSHGICQNLSPAGAYTSSATTQSYSSSLHNAALFSKVPALNAKEGQPL